MAALGLESRALIGRDGSGRPEGASVFTDTVRGKGEPRLTTPSPVAHPKITPIGGAARRRPAPASKAWRGF